MQNEKKHLENNQMLLESIASNIVHELKTPLVAIKSSISCAREVFPKLIEVYEDAYSDISIDEKIEFSYLQKIFKSLNNSMSEIVISNYFLNKLHDILKGENFNLNESALVSLGDVIGGAIDFHALRIENCRNKFIVNDKLERFTVNADKKYLERAVLYLLDNLLRITSASAGSLIYIFLQGELAETCKFLVKGVKDFTFVEYLFDMFPVKNKFKIGDGMFFFKKFVEKSGWDLKVEKAIDKFSIEINFKGVFNEY